jgi:hypothetical protein
MSKADVAPCAGADALRADPAEKPVIGREASAGQGSHQRSRPGGTDSGEVDSFRHAAVAPEGGERAVSIFAAARNVSDPAATDPSWSASDNRRR